MVSKESYAQKREQSLDSIISYVDKELAKLNPEIALPSEDIKDTEKGSLSLKFKTAYDEADQQQAWKMIKSALLHLKEGGPKKTAGMMSGALSKLNLRNTPIAATLNVPKPDYMPQKDFMVEIVGTENAAIQEVLLLLRTAQDYMPADTKLIMDVLKTPIPESPQAGSLKKETKDFSSEDLKNANRLIVNELEKNVYSLSESLQKSCLILQTHVESMLNGNYAAEYFTCQKHFHNPTSH